jgi:hypothetical protein
LRESQPTRPVTRPTFLPRRLATLLLTMTVLGIVAAASPVAVATATGSCSGYANYVSPPKYIRVLRQSGPSSGHSVKVNFRSWAKHVLGTQMPGYYPTEALRANAVYVKQYGWYYEMAGHWRGGRDAYGKCYDIKDAGDGWYVPETHSYTTSQSEAMDATWNYSLRKWSYGHWKFVLTGYRAGAFVSCGVDSDGWHLMQHSAYDCAKDGKTWRQIIHKYLTHSWIVYRWG